MDETPVAGVARTVVIADDDVLLREGLASLLTQAGYSVVGQAGDATMLWILSASIGPGSPSSTSECRPTMGPKVFSSAGPSRGGCRKIAILVLSAYVEVKHATMLPASGERTGYLLKSRIANIDEFLESIDRLSRWRLGARPVPVVELLGARTADDPLAAITRVSVKCWP